MQKGDMKLLFFKIYFVFPNFSEGNKTAEVSEGMFTSALTCLSHNTAQQLVSSYAVHKVDWHENKHKEQTGTSGRLKSMLGSVYSFL